MGRNTKLTKKVLEKIVKCIKNGSYACVAAQYAGIGETTYFNWIARAKIESKEGKKTIFVQFWEAIKEADAEAEYRNVQVIQKAGLDKQDGEGRLVKGSWQASAWYLERKHYGRWGAKQKIEHSGSITNIDIKNLTTEQLQKISQLNTDDENIDEKINAIIAATD